MTALRRTFFALTALSIAACAPPAPPTPDAEAPRDAMTVMDAAGSTDAAAPSRDVEVPDVAMTPLPDFALTDRNPRSATNATAVSLNAQRGKISAWYFATSSCHFCVSMVSQLERLQRELAAANPTRPVQIFVIADLDSDGATAIFSAETTLPVLQDDRVSHVQSNWMAAIRDVVVVDDEGTRRLVYNLTTRPLNDALYFNDLKVRLLALANR